MKSPVVYHSSKIKILLLLSIIIFLSPGLFAQNCGPSCPVCSGNTDGSMLSPGSFFFTTMYIGNGEEERGVLNLRYGLFSWMDLGVGYGVEADKVIWNARVQVLKEGEESIRPGIILGTGSVRTGESDQSVYLHLTRSWEFSDNFAMRVTAGSAVLIPETDKFYGLAGMTFSIAEKYSLFVNYDGISFHEGFSWIPLDWLTLSALLVESKDLAISVGIKWGYAKDK